MLKTETEEKKSNRRKNQPPPLEINGNLPNCYTYQLYMYITYNTQFINNYNLHYHISTLRLIILIFVSHSYKLHKIWIEFNNLLEHLAPLIGKLVMFTAWYTRLPTQKTNNGPSHGAVSGFAEIGQQLGRPWIEHHCQRIKQKHKFSSTRW